MQCHSCNFVLHISSNDASKDDKKIYASDTKNINSLISDGCLKYPLYSCSEKQDCSSITEKSASYGVAGLHCKNSIDFHNSLCTGTLK